MARYIDADEVLKEMAVNVLPRDAQHLYLAMRGIVRNTPTADVKEVKHGEWQEERWCDNFQHICSLCHSTVRVHPQSVAYKYCPYCGAKNGRKGR